MICDRWHGRDLSGSLERAGGIGGLLAIQDTNSTPSSDTDDLRYVYFYDANGNVGQVLDGAAPSAAAAVRAHYEYDPYGNRTNFAVTLEYEQPFRFSTKQFDAETGLGYWGYRYYSPKLGRWVSRDPIRERGGFNLYAYARNMPSRAIDPRGLKSGVYTPPVTLTQDAYVMDWDWFSGNDVEVHATFSITMDRSKTGQVLIQGYDGPRIDMNKWDANWGSFGPIINPVVCPSAQCNNGFVIHWGTGAVEGDFPASEVGSAGVVGGAVIGAAVGGVKGFPVGATVGGAGGLALGGVIDLVFDVEAQWLFEYVIRACCVCTSGGKYKLSVDIDRVGRLRSGKDLEDNEWGWDLYTKYVETP